MRIGIIGTGVRPIPPVGYGGVERTIAELANALRAVGEDVTIVNDPGHGRGFDEYRFALTLGRRLHGASFDVLHAHTPIVANRLIARGGPLVYTTHSRHWFVRKGVRERLGAWWERRAVRRAPATIALTDRVAARIRSELAGRGLPQLTTIPIGVDADRFRPDWARRTGHRALGVGIVSPIKRWELAAAALRGLGVRLTIIGPTPDPGYAEAVRAAGDDVVLAGEVDGPTLERAFAESDLLVHPSAVELLPGVVLQGLAAALPVLGAEPLDGLVRPGATGVVAAPTADAQGIVAALAQGARALLADDTARRRMGEAARADALDRFSWRTVAERHREVYARVAIATRPRGPST